MSQKVHFVGTNSGWKWAGVLGDNKRGGTIQECGVFCFCKDHANLSMVTSAVSGRHGSKHCSKFMGELVHVFIGWLSVDLSDVEFLEAFFDVLFEPMIAMRCAFCFREELFATARQGQKISCNEQVAMNL